MEKNMRREEILYGDIKPILIKLALPIILGNAIQTVYQITDMFWVSRLSDGDLAVASINFVWPVIFVMISFGIGMNIAGISIISQFIGLNKTRQASMVAGQLVSFSLVFSVVLAFVGLLRGQWLLELLGAEGAILNNSWTFLRIIFAGAPMMFVFFAFQSIKQGQGDTTTPMLLAGSSVILNIILDPIFMFTFNMGIAGAAYATVVSRTLASLAGCYLLFFHTRGIKLKVADLHFNAEVLKKIIRVGLPSAFGNSIEGIGFMILNSFVLAFGAHTLTAFGIGNRINSLILMPAMGIGAALATVIGQNLGAGQKQRAVTAFKASIKLSVTILTIGGFIIFLISERIIGIFTTNPLVLEQGTFFLKLISLSLPLMGIFQSFIGTFQGAGHTVTSMLITSGRLWGLRIPLIILLRNFTALEEKSIWVAMVVSNFIICIIAYFVFATGRWQNPIVDEKEDFTKNLDLTEETI